MSLKIGNKQVTNLYVGSTQVKGVYIGSTQVFGAVSPPPTPVGGGIVFGALTRAGQGGVPVTGSSITSGSGRSYWQIKNGYLSPSGSGQGKISGTYKLTLNDGSTVDITVVPNRYDVRGDTELNSVINLGSSARSGKTINLRAGNYGKLNLAGISNNSYCTLQSDSADRTYTWGYGTTETIKNRSGVAMLAGVKLGDSGARYWRFKNLRFYRKPTGSFPALVEVRGCQDIEFSRCEFHSDQLTYSAKGNGGSGNEGRMQPYALGTGSSTANGGAINFKIEDCFFHDLGQSTNLICKSNVSIQRNVMRDIWKNFIELIDQYPGSVTARTASDIVIRDNVCIGNTASYWDKSIHSACFAFQMEYKKRVKILANVVMPVYQWSITGPPDVDGENSDTFSEDCEINGNIFVAIQAWNRIKGPKGTCKQIGNTLFLRYIKNKQKFSITPGMNSSGPETIWHGPVYNNGHINKHNITMGTSSSGLRWGKGAGGSAASSVTNDQYNLGFGHGLYVMTDSAGRITDWGQSDDGITINGVRRDVRYDKIFPKANNAAGDFAALRHIDMLTVRSDIASYLGGQWVGAVGSGYVTYQPGHMTDPKQSTINTSME